jgi:hypothetical protein
VAAVVGAVHARGVRDVVDAGVVAALSAPLAAGVRF